MREINFRGRDDALIWHYGDLVTMTVGRPLIIDSVIVDNDIGEPITVDPATVGQFTGLRDVDGREIYEGDILRYTRDNGVVFWNSAECRWCIEMGDGEVFILATRNAHFWHVVGNIYDNPELLRGDGDA